MLFNVCAILGITYACRTELNLRICCTARMLHCCSNIYTDFGILWNRRRSWSDELQICMAAYFLLWHLNSQISILGFHDLNYLDCNCLKWAFRRAFSKSIHILLRSLWYVAANLDSLLQHNHGGFTNDLRVFGHYLLLLFPPVPSSSFCDDLELPKIYSHLLKHIMIDDDRSAFNRETESPSIEVEHFTCGSLLMIF